MIYQMPAANTEAEKRARLAMILGDEFAQSAYLVDFAKDGFHFTGYVAPPALTRSQRDRQWIYVNRRFVRDKMLFSAVASAYRDVMQPGRHAQVVLYIHCDPAMVDVNIHPAKEEIRFADHRQAYSLVVKAITAELAKPLSNAIPNHVSAPVKPIDRVQSSSVMAQSCEIERKPSFSVAAAPTNQVNMCLSTPAGSSKQDNSASVAIEGTILPIVRVAEQVSRVQQNSVQQSEGQSVELFLGTAVAQIHGIYIVAQTEDAMVIVDMHAGHERVLYEKLKNQLAASSVVTQSLLVPIVVDCDQQEMRVFEDFNLAFSQLGFDVSSVGPQSLCVRSIPALLKNTQINELIHDALSDLANTGSACSVEERTNSLLGTIGCHRAIRANRSLSLAEMNALLREMEQTERSGACNHGRPTYWKIPVKELDLKFSRGS